MIQFQSVANDIRDQLLDNEAVRRLRIEVLWASATPAPARWRRSSEDPAARYQEPDAGSLTEGWAAARR